MKKTVYCLLSLFVSITAIGQKRLDTESITVSRQGFFELRTLPSREPDRLSPRPVRVINPNQADKRDHFRPKSEERRREKKLQEKNVMPVTPVEATVIRQNSKPAAPQIFESPCTSFRGMSLFSFRPPDVTSAAGADYIMLADNDSTCVITKEGQIVWRESQNQAGGFWSTVPYTRLFDPKLTYDALSHRWIYVICTDQPAPPPGSPPGTPAVASATSSFIIAVSATYDPFDGWFVYEFDADADDNQWFDYPSVGFNRNWIVVTGNMFANPGFSVTGECRGFILNKNQMYAGASVTASVFNASSEYSTICPALTYDAGENDLWLATNDDVDDNDIRFFRIGGSAASPTVNEEGFISITGDWGNGNMNIAPQSGNSATLHAGDHDIMSAVFRNGRLYTAQTIFIPDGGSPTSCTIQLIACTPGSTTVHEAIRFASNGNSMHAYPNASITSNGEWVVSCARFTNTTFPSAAVLVRRSGSSTFFESVIQSGQDWYVGPDASGRNRWGDYSGSMIDPMDHNSAWVAGEYSLPRTAGNNGNWATWVAKICSNICDLNTFVNTTQINGTIKKYEASGTVFASSTIQPGAYIKLDGGGRVVLQPGFRANIGSRVRAFIEGCGGPQ